MKRLIIVCWYSPGSKNVGYRRALQIANYCVNKGFDVLYITSYSPVVNSKDFVDERIKFRALIDGTASQKKKNYIFLSSIKGFIRRNLAPQILDMKIIKIFKLNNIISEFKISEKDYIFATSPPVFDLFAGVYIKYKTGSKLILDYRDLFSGSHLFSRLLYPLERWIERKINNYANIVSTVSSPWVEKIGNGCILLPNGFEAREFLSIKVGKISNRLRYFGSINHPDRLPKELIPILIKLSKLYTIEFYGDCDFLKSKINVNNNIIFERYTEYKDALQLMAESFGNILIGFEDEGDISRRGMIQTKCYEYMAVKRPIIYIGANNCATFDIVVPSGLVNNVEVLLSSQEPEISVNNDYINQFSRENVSKKLLGFLK